VVRRENFTHAGLGRNIGVVAMCQSETAWCWTHFKKIFWKNRPTRKRSKRSMLPFTWERSTGNDSVAVMCENHFEILNSSENSNINTLGKAKREKT